MNKVTARAPVRADLAGGTLDLWPLYLFHPGSRTVNVAISYYAESEVVETGDSGIEINLTDQQYEQRYESLHEIAADGHILWLAIALGTGVGFLAYLAAWIVMPSDRGMAPEVYMSPHPEAG